MDRLGENVQTVGGIPEEDFRAAIEASCRNPVFSRYLEDAPAGARRFIGLQFYMAVYPDRVDGPKYRRCLAELEPGLGVGDIDYVLPWTNDQAAKAYLQQLRDRLVPLAAPPLQRVEEILPRSATVRVPRPQPPPQDPAPRKEPPAPRKEPPAPQEYGRPVMSEYERQRRTYRRREMREKALRLIGQLFLLFLVVLVGYGVAGYLAIVHLPRKIAELEPRVSASRADQGKIQEDRALLRGLKDKAGISAKETNAGKRLQMYESVLESPAFQELEGRCGKSVPKDKAGELSEIRRRFTVLRGKIGAQERHISMLDKDFKGRIGKGSPAWKAKMAKAQSELAGLKTQLEELDRARDAALSRAEIRLKAVESALAAAAPGGASEDEARLESLREWRDWLMVWPLPEVAARMAAKKE